MGTSFFPNCPSDIFSENISPVFSDVFVLILINQAIILWVGLGAPGRKVFTEQSSMATLYFSDSSTMRVLMSYNRVEKQTPSY